MSSQVGGVVGALISGVLISAFGAGWLFVIIGLFYFASVMILLGAKESGNSAPRAQRLNNTFVGNFKAYINFAFPSRVRGHYRWQILLRGSNPRALLDTVRFRRNAGRAGKMRDGWIVDVSPSFQG